MSSPTRPVLLLSDALARLPDARLVVYQRVSSYSQAGPGRIKLVAKTDALVREVHALAPGQIRAIGRGVEEGQLSKRRPALLDAARRARALGPSAVLVAADLSRFIRSESYDRRTAPDAWPTPEEFARLREVTGDVTLATILDPAAPEAVRHGRATRRTGRCGRPSTLTHKQALWILEELGHFCDWIDGRLRWTESLSAVAKKCGVTRATGTPASTAIRTRPAPGRGRQ